ncbi:MAG TPA: threo-3-hydroxy-L-aspartate ammonia-lyase [Vicinamibacterales bacterium]|nr:threo-3-hydroxy-L-aspartate ammonia-lyase [Vicinamibacterales bacterium]
MTPLPTYADIEAAAARLHGVAHRTPVVTSRSVDTRTGATVFFKCENLQRAGAFKFRGAYNAMAQLADDAKRRGVVAFSSGNHAAAIALAGQLLHVPCVIVMPYDAPAVKRAAAEGYGADVVYYDRETEDREAIGRKFAEERGLSLIPPYDDANVIAGQGTAARELFQDVGPLDLLLVPCGGGGLLAGSALAAAALSPGCRVIGVEPAEGDDATRSFRTKKLQSIHNPQTVADGARTLSMSELTFTLMLQHVSDMITVDDRRLLDAMFYVWERLKLVVEPTAALGAAAAFDPAVVKPGSRVGVILTAGNVDLADAAKWVAAR